MTNWNGLIRFTMWNKASFIMACGNFKIEIIPPNEDIAVWYSVLTGWSAVSAYLDKFGIGLPLSLVAWEASFCFPANR